MQDTDGEQLKQSRYHFVCEEGISNKKKLSKYNFIKINSKAIQHMHFFADQPVLNYVVRSTVRRVGRDFLL
jgi:hypothetical protein